MPQLRILPAIRLRFQRRFMLRFTLRFALVFIALLCAVLAFAKHRADVQWRATESLLHSGASLELSQRDWAVCVYLRRWEFGRSVEHAFLPPLVETADLSQVPADALDGALTDLGKISNVASVILRGHSLTSAQLTLLASATSVLELSLAGSGSRIPEDGFGQIASLPHLRALYLEGADLSDRHCEQLLRAKHLEELDVSRTRITENGVRVIARLSSLKSLDVAGVSASSEVLAELTSLTSLVYLYASHTAVGDSAAAAFARLPKLEALIVQETKVSNECVAEIEASHPSLLIVN
jgi:hypothetical protein